MSKNIQLIIYLVGGLLVINSASADTNSDYAKSVNDTAVSGAKNGSPWTVPNYAEPHPDYESLMYDGDQLKIQGKNASTTNEAAQVIYNLPHAAINQSDGWYQNASNTTNNPSSALPTATETNCTTTTVPGNTVTTTQSCITSETTTNKTCKTPVQVTVDADYDYECHKNRQSVGQNCQVGHLINVTKSWNYRCTKTQVFQNVSCDQYYAIDNGSLTCGTGGWSLSSTTCTKPATGSNTQYCPYPYVNNSGHSGPNNTWIITQCCEDSSHCVRPNTRTSYSCPSGSTLSGTTCIKTATGTPPSTYFVNNCTAYE